MIKTYTSSVKNDTKGKNLINIDRSLKKEIEGENKCNLIM